jgi:hypothetical protein
MSLKAIRFFSGCCNKNISFTEAALLFQSAIKKNIKQKFAELMYLLVKVLMTFL